MILRSVFSFIANINIACIGNPLWTDWMTQCGAFRVFWQNKTEEAAVLLLWHNYCREANKLMCLQREREVGVTEGRRRQTFLRGRTWLFLMQMGQTAAAAGGWKHSPYQKRQLPSLSHILPQISLWKKTPEPQKKYYTAPHDRTGELQYKKQL